MANLHTEYELYSIYDSSLLSKKCNEITEGRRIGWYNEQMNISIPLLILVGDGRVVRQCRVVLLIWILAGQGPLRLQVGMGRGCFWTFFSSVISLLSPSLWETTRYRLKYCLKGLFNPNNQPTNIFLTGVNIYVCCVTSIVCAYFTETENCSMFWLLQIDKIDYELQ